MTGAWGYGEHQVEEHQAPRPPWQILMVQLDDRVCVDPEQIVAVRKTSETSVNLYLEHGHVVTVDRPYVEVMRVLTVGPA